MEAQSSQCTTGPHSSTRLEKIPGIKKLHHFRCASSKPGLVYVKENADTSEREINLMISTTPWSPYPKVLCSQRVCQLSNSGTFKTAFVSFVLMVIKTFLVLYPTFQGQLLQIFLVHLLELLQLQKKTTFHHPPSVGAAVVAEGHNSLSYRYKEQ